MKTKISVAIFLAGFLGMSAQASTGVSCLIYGKLTQKSTITGDSKHEYTIVVKKVDDDLAGRNDFKDCRTRFKKGQSIVFSAEQNIDLKHHPRVWLNYTYGDDRGGARWEGYTFIKQQTYKERKNGILR